MNRGVALGRGLLVTLATPPTWPLALAAFLIRGGILLLVVPIVVMDRPKGSVLTNQHRPQVTGDYDAWTPGS